MVTKEPREYYRLVGKYLFQNIITGREAEISGRSDPTISKMCWEMLPTLREQAIDRAKNWLALVLHTDNSKEFKLQWVLVEILDEEWQKL